MQTVTYDSLGVKVNIANVPSTIEEFDTNAKKVGAALEEAINNVVYRGYLADFRALFCEAVEEYCGIPRKTSTLKKGDKEVEVWDETEGKYLSRVRATKGWEDDVTELQKIADKIVENPELKFDASATERKAPGPKKLPENYKNAASRVFANGTQDKWATKLSLVYSGDKDKDIEVLGWAIKKVEDDKRKAAVELEYV